MCFFLSGGLARFVGEAPLRVFLLVSATSWATFEGGFLVDLLSVRRIIFFTGDSRCGTAVVLCLATRSFTFTFFELSFWGCVLPSVSAIMDWTREVSDVKEGCDDTDGSLDMVDLRVGK